MKSINSFFLKKCITIIVLIAFTISFIGCSYFKARNIFTGDIPNINDIGRIHKYFVVHSEGRLYTISNITVDEDYIYGDIDYTDRHFHYYEGRPDRVGSHERDIFHEVHIYLSKSSSITTETKQISTKNVREVKIIEANTGKTIESFLLGTIGVGLGVFIIVTIVL